MVTGSDKTARLAVLIDADNAQPATIDALLAEVAKFGTAHVKRAYGDWTALVSQLRNAVEAASDDDGWAALASVGQIITNQSPDFDSRTYGYAKLSDLMAATTLFELDRRSSGDGKPEIVYARDKRRRPARKPRPAAARRRASAAPADDDPPG
jgi:hypothetical protein